MIAQYGALAGLAVGGAALVLVSSRPYPWQHVTGTARLRWVLLALLLLSATAVTVVIVVAALGLIELAGARTALVVEAVIGAAAYGLEVLAFSGRSSRRLLLGVRGVVVVAASWITLRYGDPEAFASGVAVGLLAAQGIRMVKSLASDHLQQEHSHRAWPMPLWALGGIVGGFLIALGLAADLSTSHAAAVVGVVVGAVVAKPWRRRPPVLAGPLARLLHHTLLEWTGYLPIHRGAFLRYAADRYVLARTGRGQYSFIHLLVREHLAECSPDELAAKVEKRIAERAASGHRSGARRA
jgi:hypothetical protein